MESLSISILVPSFILCFVGILVTAYWSIESVKAVSEKFKISETFLGAVFLSVGTSFPEFINSIISGFKDFATNSTTNSIYSFFNVTGANVWQVVFLVVVLSFLTVLYKFQHKESQLEEISEIFWNDSFLSWKLIVLDTLVLMIAFFVPFLFSPFIIRGFNLWNLFFVFVWLWYLSKTYKTSSDNISIDKVKHFLDWNKPSLFAITVFLWILFGIFAYGNFYISSQFKIGDSVAFGIILSFITSTPEFSVLFYLLRKKDYRIAIGSFFGSSLFNLTLPCYTNLISLNPILGVSQTKKLEWWLALNLIVLLLFIFSFIRFKRFKSIFVVMNGVLISAIYIVANYFFASYTN